MEKKPILMIMMTILAGTIFLVSCKISCHQKSTDTTEDTGQ